MPLEVECHTVPHLKALTRGIEHRGGHGRVNIFRGQKINLKSAILLHKWPKRQFHVTVAVHHLLQGCLWRRPLAHPLGSRHSGRDI